MLAAAAASFLVSSCSSTTDNLLKIPFLSLNVKAVDEKEQPVAGALVEASDGQRVTTDADGVAALKFGSLGVHTVTVAAQDRAPSVFTVTMPVDRGKTVTARLGQPVEIRANISVTGNVGGFFTGMMAGQLYPFLFQSLFVAHGYNTELAPYEPGQWTEWRFRDDEDGEHSSMRKACLTRLENGQEWWQIHLPGETPDETLTLEVLFGKGRNSIRRMRQKTGNQEAQEVPVAEGWYTEPAVLTPESLEGAVKTRGVTVEVPAGSFQADLLEFTTLGDGGVLRLWRVKGVPGGVVRVAVVDAGGKLEWDSQLAAHGNDARTALASY